MLANQTKGGIRSKLIMFQQSIVNQAMKNYLIAEHNLPRTLKTIIYDCIHNEHAHTHFKTSEYLLQINPTNQAEVFFFDTQLTAITNNLKIKYLNNEKCLVFKNKQQQYKMLACSKQEITIYRAKVDEFGEFCDQFQIFHFKANLQKNEEILYISESITLANTQYYIAYTNKDEFYLISTHYEYSRYVFECVKLNDLDDNKGIFGWFSKRQKRHYTTVKLHLIGLSTGQQAIRVVSVRDAQIIVHLVEIMPQIKDSTIKIVSKANNISKLISNKCTLFDTFLLKNQVQGNNLYEKEHAIKFIAVFKQKERTDFINVQIFMSQTQVLPHCNLIFSLESSFFLAMVSSHALFFFCWFNHQTKKYIVNLFTQEELKSLSKENLHESRTYLEKDNQIFLCRGNNEVYFFTQSNIFKYEHFEANLKESALYLQNIKNLQRILYKAVQIEDYEQITKVISKIEDNYKLIAESQDDHVKQYLYTFVLRKVLDSKYLLKLQKMIKSSPHHREYGQNLLSEACKQIDFEHVKLLIDFISQRKLYEMLVNDIIYEVSKEFCQNGNAAVYQPFLDELFSEAIETTLTELSSQFEQNPQNLKWYYLLINSFIYFKQIEPDHLEPIINHNQDKFIEKIIINHQKMQLFLHYFNNSNIEFDASDIRVLFQKAEQSQADINAFIARLIRVSHQEWKNKEGDQKKYYLQFVRKRLTAMLHSLEKYSQIIIEQLEHTYPGLAAYFYMKKDRKKYADRLLSLANKSENPETSYILRLAAGKNKGNDQAVLDQIRLCHQLKQINLTPQQLVAQLKKNNFNDVEVRRQTWQSWKKSHKNLNQNFSEMEKKLSFYRND